MENKKKEDAKKEVKLSKIKKYHRKNLNSLENRLTLMGNNFLYSTYAVNAVAIDINRNICQKIRIYNCKNDSKTVDSAFANRKIKYNLYKKITYAYNLNSNIVCYDNYGNIRKVNIVDDLLMLDNFNHKNITKFLNKYGSLLPVSEGIAYDFNFNEITGILQRLQYTFKAFDELKKTKDTDYFKLLHYITYLMLSDPITITSEKDTKFTSCKYEFAEMLNDDIKSGNYEPPKSFAIWSGREDLEQQVPYSILGSSNYTLPSVRYYIPICDSFRRLFITKTGVCTDIRKVIEFYHTFITCVAKIEKVDTAGNIIYKIESIEHTSSYEYAKYKFNEFINDLLEIKRATLSTTDKFDFVEFISTLNINPSTTDFIERLNLQYKLTPVETKEILLNLYDNFLLSIIDIASYVIKKEIDNATSYIRPNFSFETDATPWIIPNLITALYFSLFYRGHGKYIFRKCTNNSCGHYFQVAATNNTKLYCNDVCRVAFNRKKGPSKNEVIAPIKK